MHRSILRWLVAPCLVLVGVTGCGSDSTRSAYPECIGAARYGDATYREIGFTDREGEPLTERAAYASCVAVERDGAASKALRDAPTAVDARSLPGYRTDEAIVVQVTDRAWSVLVSADAPSTVVRRIRGSGLLNAGEQ